MIVAPGSRPGDFKLVLGWGSCHCDRCDPVLECQIFLPETGVREVGETETAPEGFALLQNYPNPFNPITNIKFMLPEPAWVKVEIYNILGKKIVTLVDEKLSTGHKIVEWDGKDNQGNEVSTGIYFYRLRAGDFTQTRKMVLF